MSDEIVCRNVSLGYESGIVAENIDFTVCSGDYLCILGENGYRLYGQQRSNIVSNCILQIFDILSSLCYNR